jgi:hypothetical protein
MDRDTEILSICRPRRRVASRMKGKSMGFACQGCHSVGLLKNGDMMGTSDYGWTV